MHVWGSEPTTETYYFGIPPEYKDDISSTPVMFAFEVYQDRDVRRTLTCFLVKGDKGGVIPEQYGLHS